MSALGPATSTALAFAATTLVPLGITVGLSFLLGLELHRYLRAEGTSLGFGTARTLTLLGTAGFVLDLLGEDGLPLALGLAAVAIWLSLYYRERLRAGEGGLLVPLIALLTYLLGPLARRTPFWFPVLIAALVLLLLTERPRIRHFEEWLPEGEVAIVLRFVIMAGIILPLLPDTRIASFIPISYRQTWLAVVAVSGISYASYLAQTYLFKRRGLLLTGVLGGLYSSTATTFVVAEKARQSADMGIVSAALILATAMMYIRLLVLNLLFAPRLIPLLAPAFGAGALVSAAAAILTWRLFPSAQSEDLAKPPGHPLELRAALLFAALFVLFASVTDLVAKHYGGEGVKTLSLVVGLTDIDPFILSLFGGHFAVSSGLIVSAVIVAAGSNNFLKAWYAIGMARRRTVIPAAAFLIALAVGSFAYAFL